MCTESATSSVSAVKGTAEANFDNVAITVAESHRCYIIK